MHTQLYQLREIHFEDLNILRFKTDKCFDLGE